MSKLVMDNATYDRIFNAVVKATGKGIVARDVPNTRPRSERVWGICYAFQVLGVDFTIQPVASGAAVVVGNRLRAKEFQFTNEHDVIAFLTRRIRRAKSAK